jgi:hypothetical protein
MPCFTRHRRHPRRLLWPKGGSGGAQPESPIGPDVTRHRAPNRHLGMSIQPRQEARHGAVAKDRILESGVAMDRITGVPFADPLTDGCAPATRSG